MPADLCFVLVFTVQITRRAFFVGARAQPPKRTKMEQKLEQNGGPNEQNCHPEGGPGARVDLAAGRAASEADLGSLVDLAAG